jgi:hypothetical protein
MRNVVMLSVMARLSALLFNIFDTMHYCIFESFRILITVSDICPNDEETKQDENDWRHGTQHNDTQHNDTQHNDTQHNDTVQHNDTQHNDTQHNGTQHNVNQHSATQHNDTLNDIQHNDT